MKDALAQQEAVIAELKDIKFQSATLTFDRDFTIDLEIVKCGSNSWDAAIPAATPWFIYPKKESLWLAIL